MGCSVFSKPDNGLVSNPTETPVRVPSPRTRIWTSNAGAGEVVNGSLQLSLAALNEESTDTGLLSVGASVRVHSLVGQTEHNNTIGTIETHDARTGRWKVKMSGGQVLTLKPPNLMLVSTSGSSLAQTHATQSDAAVAPVHSSTPSTPGSTALLLCPQPTEEDDNGESRRLQASTGVFIERLESKSKAPRRERTPWKEKLNENIHVRMRLLQESQVLDTLRGRLHFEDVPSRNILVFISSTFTDTAAERNILLQDVFPYLDEYARKHGYYFQGSEMRWGIRKHASEDNMTAEICLSEMENCQESSGVNYVLLQTQKYGYQPLPKRIDQAVFQRMLECANSLESNSLRAHYVLDNNKLEPEYVLEIRSLSKDEWCKLEIELRRVLQDCAIRAWPDLDICDPACHHPAKNFFISVTEMEICKGLIQQPDRDQKCLVFSRTITDLSEMLNKADADRKMIGNYLDLLDGALKHEEQQRLRWCHENIPLICKKDPLNHWDVKWGPGVSAETHPLYLEEFADRFCMLMMNSIKQQIVAEERIDDHIYSEVQSHMEIAVNRAGRYVETEWGQKILSEVISYVKDSQSRIIIIQGASGSGKSSLMAKLCKEISQEYGPPPSPKSATIISRFLGSTYSSSSARGLICSILEQIDRIHHLVNQKAHTSGDEHKCPVWKRKRVTKGMNNSDFPTKFDELARDFRNSLAQASSTYPLVLILDHVDQLCEDDDGALSCWLPTNLPSNVIIIISALEPDAGSVKCQFLSNFKSKIQDDPLTVIHIPGTGQDDGNTMLENFLSRRGRLLSESQKSLLLESFKENSTPRWLEVASGLVMTLTSYMPFDRLNSTLSGMLLVSIETFELTHGCQLVKSVSTYVALSRFGVSESELLQLLSLNDLVLADVYEWWVPPLRILPPMLLKRLLQDYQPYMRSRTKGGSSLLAFLDTVITDTLLAVYVTEDKVKEVHHDLMHFFLGTWAGKMKPYQDVLKRKLSQFGLTESQGDRLVIPQPLILHSTAPFFCALSTTSSSTFHSYVNVRKVDELIYHCCRAGDEWYTMVLKRQDGIGFIRTCDEPLVQIDGDSGDNVPGDSEDSAKTVAGAGHAHEGSGGSGRVAEGSGGDVHEGFAAEAVAETGHPGREGGHGDGGPSSTVKIVLSQICCLQYFYAKCAAGRLRDLMRHSEFFSKGQNVHESIEGMVRHTQSSLQ